MKNLKGKRFQKRVENFTCENCGSNVKGNGYTDHCNYCLWSKHVDINPGDRKSDCKGLMKPVSIETKGKIKIIHYVCTKCNYQHKVKASENDNFEEILKLSQQNNPN